MTDETSPYAPHTDDEVREMLKAVDAESVDDLFDVPDELLYDGEFGVDAKTEREVVRHVDELLSRNDDAVEFLGRGSYDHYVPSAVDHLTSRSEFLTSYTQYQPEVAQGSLQALFEYQSILVELTGLEVANASVYDAATALGEAALLSARVEGGDRVLVPDILLDSRESVLRNYVDGTGLSVDVYPTEDGNTDIEAVGEAVDEDAVMVYAETPNARGCLEENLDALGDITDENDALFCVGSDPVALSVLEPPAKAGADIVVGDASVLGAPTAYGTGLGMFAVDEAHVRQVPGHLVGASTDASGRRAYTLTLQTREQHIRKERATSNICTNQAWMAIRAAVHAALLGATGLVEIAERCVEEPRALAERLDGIDGVTAPVHDRPHFREFAARVGDAPRVRDELHERGYAVHAVSDDKVQVCVTETNADETDGLVAAFKEVAA
ncbi:MAG: aminomethyl-transferring glycine dehydrogenase subunit GcvPA [Halobacteriales archaeon]